MKASVTPTAKMKLRMAEETYTDFQVAAAEACAIVMVEMAEYFMIEPEGLQNFWQYYLTEAKPQWDEYERDEIFSIKIREAVEAYGLDASEMLDPTESLRDAMNKKKKQLRPQLTMAEAAKMKQFLEGFKSIQNSLL